MGRSAVGSRSKRDQRSRLHAVESLEKREVLSGFAGATFDLAIRGTGVQYSELGLPASMSGDLFSDSSEGSNRIGRYEEVLTPILMDVTGDQIPDFVGTTGVATFEFFVGPAAWALGSITTHNVSFIQNVMPTGEIIVGSQGTIVAATRLLSQVTGTFVSQSTVALGPAFAMETQVEFTVSTPNTSTLVLMAVCTDGRSLAHCEEQPEKPRTTRSDAPHSQGEHSQRLSHDAGCRHTMVERGRQERAIDRAMEEAFDGSSSDTEGSSLAQRHGRRSHLC